MVQQGQSERFSIGALAGMVGVPVETLRTWERRYGLPAPERVAGGRRQYTLGEVERLRRVVLLVRHGERVRDLAELSAARLDERLALYGPSEPGLPAAPTLAVGLIHPGGLTALAGLSAAGRLDVVARAQRPEDLPPVHLDAVVVHASALPADPGPTLDALEARHDPDAVMVLASFLPGLTRRTLLARGARVIDEGARAEVLRQAVEDAVLATRLSAGPRSASASTAPPSALYRREELERILNSSTSIQCECPAHLAGLVLRLRDFERFSQECGIDSPAQAALHAALGEGSARAAASLEELLARVLAADGLDPRV